MDPLQLIGYIFEGITIIAGVTSTYFILKKNRNYLGNIMMASAIACTTLYITCITIYDIFLPITLDDTLVYIFLPLALTAIVSAGMFLFFTMITMTKGESWVKDLKKSIWFILPVIAFAIFVLMTGSENITIVDREHVDTSTGPYFMLPMAFLLLFFIASSLVMTFTAGISKSTDETRQKLIRFEFGLAIMMFALLFNVLKGMISDDPTVSGILDMVYFGILAAGMVVFAFTFSAD